MNKRILSVFVFSAALLSIQAQDRKGGISDAMLNQIKQSYEGTSADKALMPLATMTSANLPSTRRI